MERDPKSNPLFKCMRVRGVPKTNFPQKDDNKFKSNNIVNPRNNDGRDKSTRDIEYMAKGLADGIN